MDNTNERSPRMEKRDRVMGKAHARGGRNTVALVAVIAIAGVALALYPRIFRPGQADSAGTSVVASRQDYAGKAIQMTAVPSRVDGGEILVRLEDVVNNKLVAFSYASGGDSGTQGSSGGPGVSTSWNSSSSEVPLLAYIAPSGKLVVAVRICEPCRSTSFAIRGEELVCNACFTRWNLETLRGVWGGCTEYPPDRLRALVEDGWVTIDLNEIQSWKPRV